MFHENDKAMYIGTDISIDVCKEEGYQMIEIDGRVKFNGDTRFYAVRWYDGAEIERVSLTVNEVWEQYMRHKAEIDKSIDFSWDFPKNAYDLVGLVSDVNYCCGLY